jgi:hypothetical protein
VLRVTLPCPRRIAPFCASCSSKTAVYIFVADLEAGGGGVTHHAKGP